MPTAASLPYYLWMAYKERTGWTRSLWFVLIMGQSNLTMFCYALKEPSRLKPEEPVWNALHRRTA